MIKPEEARKERMERYKVNNISKARESRMNKTREEMNQKFKDMSRMSKKGFNRKYGAKGSDYKPGTKVPAVEESLMKKDNLG